MPTKKSLSYIKTSVETVTETNNHKPQLLQEIFGNVEDSNNIKNNNNIGELKRKLIL